MTRKSCPFCYCTNVIKHGLRHGRQRYLCRDCATSWSGQTRGERLLKKLWREYAFDGLKVEKLAKSYHKSPNKIRAMLHSYNPSPPIDRPRPVVVVMDVTYFGSWGILVAIDPYAKGSRDENLVLYHAFIQGTEKTRDYELATDTIIASGYQIQAVVIDGRRGVKEAVLARGIPVQYCHFHQLQTITQCLTKKPKLEPNQELRYIALSLTKTTKVAFTAALDQWHEAYGEWLKERDPDTKQFVHRRTRRAYFSLRRNLDQLFTFETLKLAENPVKVPNTTNALDGRFGVWKGRIHVHHGCSKELIITMLCSFLSEPTD